MFIDIFAILVILFFAIILHECAHGWMAYKLGDPTAKLAGRLTLNPLKHVDPVGTVFLPGFLLVMKLMGFHTIIFGWAKPVPVNFLRLNNPRKDMIWVALAGPGTNIILAFLFSLLMKLPLTYGMFQTFELGVFINLLLAVFNLIPIPPLDGSRVVMGLLPKPWALSYSKLERYGILIVIGLIYLGMFNGFIVPVIEGLGALMGVKFS